MIHPSDHETYYLCGGMSNYPQFNVPAFLEGKETLKRRGFNIQLPADLDDPAIVRQLLMSPDGNHDPANTGGLTWGDCLALDVKLIADKVDGVICLPGWDKSRGARLETFVAFLCRKPVVYYPSLRKVKKRSLIRAWLGELYSKEGG